MSGVREWDRSPFEDGPPPMGGPAGSSAAPPPTERLTVGRATLVVAPLTDVDLLPEFVRSISSIPGISRVEVNAFDDGEAVLTVTAAHPVLLTGELRRVLAGRVRSCTPAGPGGRVVVDARAPLPPPPPPTPDPPVPDGREATDDPAAEDGGPRADAGPSGPEGAFGPDDGAEDTVDGQASSSDWSASWTPGGRSSAADGSGPATGARGAADRDDASDEDPGEHRSGRTRFGWGRASRGRHGRRDDDAGPGRGSDDAAGARSWSTGPAGSTSSDGGSRDAAPPPEVVAAALAGAVDETPGLSVLVFDRDLRVCAVAGVTPEDGDGSLLIGRPVVHAFAPDARRPLAAALEAALQGDERTIPLPDADGDEHLRVTCRPGAPGGRRLGVCVVRDLDVHGAGSLLIEATRAFEITFRHSPIGQGLLSSTGHWLRVNGALAELLGRPGDELVGEESVDAMHPDDRADERERLRGLVAGDEDHYVVGTRFMHVDGHVVRTHTRMTRIADEEGVTRGFVAQVVDAAAWRRFRDG